MRRVIFAAIIGAASLAIVVCAAMAVAGQEVRSAQVFTAHQASDGRIAYSKSCASCHMPDLTGNNDVPPLTGENFVSAWRTRTTKDLYDYIAGAMPPGGPALSADTYASIVAYIFESNGAAPGGRPFSADPAVAIGSVITTRSHAGAASIPSKTSD